MSKLEKYSSYKDSGVEWLGEIPEHWIISKLGTSLKPILIKNRANLPLLSVTREKGVIQRDIEDQESNHNFIPDDLSGYKMVEQGQFVMNKMKAWQGSYGVSNFTGIVSPAYYIFKLNGIEPAFFHIAVRSKTYVPFFIQASDGVRIGQWDLSKNRMKEIPFYIPPKQEQIKIASFLDTKTEQLDKAIKQKEQLIELLKERRRILINDAVTKGVPHLGNETLVSSKNGTSSGTKVPLPKMKDSGVEWIGEIPEGWEVKKLKHVSNIVLGKMICNTKSGKMKLKPYLKSKNIQWLHVDIKSVDSMWFTQNEMKEYRLKTDDIILSEGGEVGKTCIWKNELEECYIQNSAHKVTVNSLYTPHYYLYLLCSIGWKGVFNAIVNKVSIGHLTKDKLSNIYIVVPAPKEQQLIVNYIEKNNQKINKAIDLQQQQITKLKEYKTSLIDSVVTGKVRVV